MHTTPRKNEEMAERESKSKLEAWVLDKQNLYRLWDELGRISDGDFGYIKCKYKDGGTNYYADPRELMSHEKNSRRNKVINVSLSRSNFKGGSYASVNFFLPNLLSSSIYISVEKRRGDGKMDLISIENVLLSTRPHWWWMEPVKIGLVILELVSAMFMLFVVLIVLIDMFLIEEKWTLTGIEVWPLVSLLAFAVIAFLDFAFHWLLPAGTLAIGEGIRRAENMKTIRKMILWITRIIIATAVLIVTSLKVFEAI